MAIYSLGQVAIISKGAWNSAASYAILNTVTRNGGSFMAIQPNSNIEPGVTTGWESYWVAMSRGIKTIDIVGDTATTAHAVITLSDGTSVTGTTFSTYGIPDNSITTGKVVDGNITAAKLASDILPANVGIKMGTATPTTSDISAGQIYLKYT